MSRPSSSPGTSILVENDGREAARAAAEKHRRPVLARTLLPRKLGAYRGYGELLDAIERLAERGARIRQIGRSVLGEPLFAVHFGSEAPDARTSVVLAGVHPIEWIGIEACAALLDRLAGADLGDRCVIAFPMVNPDGFLRVEQSLRDGRRRWYRRNARGVDLNRNFDAHWGERSFFFYAMPWLFAPGRAPASEPEVAAIRFELSSRRVDRAVSLHSFGGAVLFPPAYTVWPVRDYAEHRSWAKAVASAARGSAEGGTRPSEGGALEGAKRPASARRRPYSAMPCSWFSMGARQGGVELDWFHERHGALSLLVECEGGPSLSLSRLSHPFAWYNPLDLARVSSSVAGALSPFVTGEPPP
jgi:hypothetical protein